MAESKPNADGRRIYDPALRGALEGYEVSSSRSRFKSFEHEHKHEQEQEQEQETPERLMATSCRRAVVVRPAQ